MTSQLIPVFVGQIQEQPVQLVDGELLHSFLEVGKRFATWITDRITQYRFQENQDYIAISQKREIGQGRGKISYHLTIDMAKELGMIERNEKGREIRKYFIEMERIAQSQYGLKSLPEPKTITKAEAGELKTVIDNKARSSEKPNAYFWSRFNNHFRVATYRELPHDRFEEAKDYLRKLEGNDADSLHVFTQKELVQFLKDNQGKQGGAENQLTIPVNTTSGLQSVDLRFDSDDEAISRWFVSVHGGHVRVQALPSDSQCLTFERWVDYATQKLGYIVLKKSEVLDRLTH